MSVREPLDVAMDEIFELEAEVARLRTALAYEKHRHEADVRILTEGARNVADELCSCSLIGTPCDEALRSVDGNTG